MDLGFDFRIFHQITTTLYAKKSFLAPTGALVLMMVYYISKAATFSDLEQLCLSILLEVSL